MTNKFIPNLVRERAKYLCEYCHSPEEASPALFQIDHTLFIVKQYYSYFASNLANLLCKS